jgi:hypothetical protein
LLDRAREIVAQLLELLQALLEVGALRRKLDETLFLLVVLLLRERVDLAQRLTAPLEALNAFGELVAVVSFCRIGVGSLESAACFVGLGFDSGTLDIDRAQALACLGCGTACIDLFGAQAAQLFCERSRARRAGIGARTQRRLEAFVAASLEILDELRSESRQRHRQRIACRRIRVLGNGSVDPSLQLVHLGGEGAAACLELEPDGFGRLAREPDLSTLGVVAEALRSHGRNPRVEQLLLRDDRQLADELARVACEDNDAAEACGPGSLGQRERGTCVCSHERRRAMAERRCDRALASRLDVEERECKPLTLLCECTRRGRQSFALGERPLECLQTVVGDSCLFPERLAFGAHACVEDTSRSRELCA